MLHQFAEISKEMAGVANSMKKIFFALLLCITLIGTGTGFVNAAGGVVPTECRAGLNNACNLCKLFELAKNFTDFLTFDLAIPIVILALLYGGFVIIMSGGDTKKVEEGRKIVTNAVVGTLIAFLAWVCINTIVLLLGVQFGAISSGDLSPGSWYEFPGCKKLNDIVAPITPPPVNPPPDEGTPWGDDSALRQSLTSIGVAINRANCTTEGQTDACTSVYNMSSRLLSVATEAKRDCPSCGITVTGGTEYWFHGNRKADSSNTSPHRNGNVADFSMNNSAFNESIKTRGTSQGSGTSCAPGPRWSYLGATWVDEKITGNPPHWHVCL